MLKHELNVMSDAGFAITGAENIERARWLAVRGRLKLEIAGITFKGRPSRVLANEITGKNCKRKIEAYNELNAFIVAQMGEKFDKPLRRTK